MGLAKTGLNKEVVLISSGLNSEILLASILHVAYWISNIPISDTYYMRLNSISYIAIMISDILC